MKTLRMWFGLLSMAGVFVCAAPARCDSLPTYLVQGTMTFIGTNACTPDPCTQEVAFSFDFSYNAIPDPDRGTVYLGYFVDSTTGMFYTLGNLGFASETNFTPQFGPGETYVFL